MTHTLAAALPPGTADDAPLMPGERVLARLDTDLDARLHFAQGTLLLTGQRLLAHTVNRTDGIDGADATDAAGAGCAQGWQAWPLRADMHLAHTDHAGVATLALQDADGLLAAWRFTLGRNPAALALLARFEQVRDARAGGQGSCDGACGADRGDGWEPAAPVADGGDGAAAPEKPASAVTLLRLWRFARPYKWRLLAAFLLMLASTAATLVPPYLSMPLMDRVLIPFQSGQAIDGGYVLLLLLGLLGAALLAWALGWAKTYILSVVSERIGADLRTATYEHLLMLSHEYFSGRRTGDLMARIGSETDRINLFLSLHLLDFATDVLMIAMTAAILFSINPVLALVTLLPLPVIGWLIHVVRDRLRTGFEKIDRVWSEVTNVLADTIPGIRVVKAFAQERREAERFREANRHNFAVNDRINRLWSLFSPTVTLLTECGLLIVWAAGIWLVARGQITVGVLTAFLAYIGRFYTRLDSMSRIVSVTQKAASATKRIFEILEHRSSVPEPANPVPLPDVRGRIELRQAALRYGNRSVIRGLDLEIAPGEMVGLVGHSGSGKSTLVNLICRFYDVSEGAVLADGVDLRDIRIADWRRNIGLVLQEPFLFFGTVAENIAYGKPGATRAEIVAAARAAHAHEFILRLPQGYDSLVGERGQGLSGGERQRISIARALLINPRILILDEATASVDTETEREIQKALDNLVRGRTTIAIAHRLSTLRKADRLVVMDKGQKVEEGTHAELMARQGAYWRLYQAQLRQEQAERDRMLDDAAQATTAAAQRQAT